MDNETKPLAPTAAAPRRSEYLDQIPQGDGEMVPTTYGGLYRLAEILTTSKLIPEAFRGDPASAMLVMMSAQEAGIPLVAGLQNSYVISGKVGWQAVILETLAKRSPKCKAFYLKSVTETEATYVVQTTEMPSPVEVSYTIEDAKAAGLLRDGSGWTKNRKDMLVARCRTRSARRYFPESILGLYSVEELREAELADKKALHKPGKPMTGSSLLDALAAPGVIEEDDGAPDPPEEQEIEVEILEVAGEPQEPAGEPEPEPEALSPEARKKLAQTARDAAAAHLGKFGPRLVENFSLTTFQKPLEELDEDQFERVDDYIAAQKKKAKP